jgi:DNA-binding MarR family transcriptional regulator
MLSSVAPAELSALVREVQHTCRCCVDERLGQYATSVTQCHAMRTIARHPGASQTQLAWLTGQSDQACSKLVARLVVRGFIERRESSRREAVHDLTVVGRVMLKESEDIIQEVLQASYAPLSDSERQALRKMLQRVLRAARLARLEPLPEPVW